MTRTGTPDVAELMAQIAELQAANRLLAERVVKLEEELALARLHRFAPRSEKHMDRIFNEAEQSTVDGNDEDRDLDEEGDSVDLPDTGLPQTEQPARKKPGRKPLPANLPRQRVDYDLADDQKACPCCSHQMHRMGELVTEQLHIEIKATVLQNARAKYACRNCDRTGINTPVVIAPMPKQPLPGSIATASTLSFALVHKYVDGTPLYRLAQAFERAGVPVSRGALGHWVIASSENHLVRIYDALKERLRSQPLIHGDEATVQVLKEEGKDPTSISYMCWGGRPPNGIETCQSESLNLKQREPPMDQTIRIGMGTSKHVFQLHGVNIDEQPVLRKKMRRREMIDFFTACSPTVIGIEACGGSHYWARLLTSLGHEVRLIAPQLVKPYVK